MQKEIVEYYCDVCGKKMDWSTDLKEIKIPVSHTEYGFLSTKNSRVVHSLEICPECMYALYKVIQKYFADIDAEGFTSFTLKPVVKSVKYKEDKDE